MPSVSLLQTAATKRKNIWYCTILRFLYNNKNSFKFKYYLLMIHGVVNMMDNLTFRLWILPNFGNNISMVFLYKILTSNTKYLNEFFEWSSILSQSHTSVILFFGFPKAKSIDRIWSLAVYSLAVKLFF